MKVNGNHISAKDVKIQVLLNNVPTDLGKKAVITGVSGSGKSSLAFDTIYSFLGSSIFIFFKLCCLAPFILILSIISLTSLFLSI